MIQLLRCVSRPTCPVFFTDTQTWTRHVTCKEAAPLASTLAYYHETFRRKEERHGSPKCGTNTCPVRVFRRVVQGQRVSRHRFAQHSRTVLELGSTQWMSLRRGTIFMCMPLGRSFFVEPEQLKRTWGCLPRALEGQWHNSPGCLRDGDTNLDGLW